MQWSLDLRRGVFTYFAVDSILVTPVQTMVWAVDCGVVHLGSDGCGLRPQMKVGYCGDSLQLVLGIDDLRDGISAACIAQVHRVYEAEGDSLVEVCLHTTTPHSCLFPEV